LRPKVKGKGFGVHIVGCGVCGADLRVLGQGLEFRPWTRCKEFTGGGGLGFKVLWLTGCTSI